MNTTVLPPNGTPGVPGTPGTPGTSTTSTLSGGKHIAPVVSTSSKAMRWLTLAAVVGPLLFTLAWIVLGVVSPGYTAWGVRIAPYSPISQPISGLGLGVTAPYMNTAFVLCGLLTLAGVVGVFHSISELGAAARWTCMLLLALSPLGMMMDGLFTLESFLPHTAGFLLAAGTPVLSFVIIGRALRRVQRWRSFGNWLLLGSPLTVALIALYFVTFTPTVAGIQSGVAGLTERILIVEVHAWFVALGWLAFRRA